MHGGHEETRVAQSLRLGNLSLTSHSRLRLEPYDSIRILMLDLAQIRVQPVKISTELGIELASCFASLFNDWIFHASTFH
jgi:hypothetical protein